MTTFPQKEKFLPSNDVMDEITTPKMHLEMEPVKKSTDQLCESIVNQKGFKGSSQN